MLEKLLKFLKNKKILILGVGTEGKSTYQFLRRNFPDQKLFMADQNTDLLEKYPEFLEDINLEISMGKEYLNGIQEYDLIIKTPGISFKNVNTETFQDKITNQVQLLLEFVPVFTIGVTGTKGKSTTSSILYEVLKEQEKDVFLLGNIGKPIFDELEHLKQDSIAILELSSHSLQYVKNSPNIAILLNLYEEHLDFYGSFEQYAQAKLNITNYQKETEYLIYNADNEFLKKYAFKATDYAVSLENKPNTKNSVWIEQNDIYCNNVCVMDLRTKLKLKGIHHMHNIMFVLAVCNIMNLDFSQSIKTIQNFEPLEHRMEFVAQIDSIEYYNDSIATIPQSTINTIKALKKVNTLIVGGKDRGVSQKELVDFLKDSEVEHIICLPKTGKAIYDELKNIANKKLWMTQNLQEAVKIAKEVTKNNTICVLSPAASSYGYFKDFRERGSLYKKYIFQDNIKIVSNNKLT